MLLSSLSSKCKYFFWKEVRELHTLLDKKLIPGAWHQIQILVYLRKITVQMKKLFAVLVAVCAMLGASMLNTSCQPYEHGFILFKVELGNYEDPHLELAYAIADGLALAGLEPESAPYYWKLDGEKNAMLKKAGNAFTSRCATIDKDRTILYHPDAPLKGVTVKLHYSFGNVDEGYCATYTFKEANK